MGLTLIIFCERSQMSSEAHQLDENHSLECINTTVTGAANSNTELMAEQPSVVKLAQTSRSTVEQRLPGHRLRVKWPGAVEKKL